MPVYSVNGTAIEGDTFTMPANDNATVNVTFVSVWSGSGSADSPTVRVFLFLRSKMRTLW